MSGLRLQQELARAGVALPVIFITGHGDVPMTVRAMKAGAVEFLTKPFDDQALLDAIHAGDRARSRQAPRRGEPRGAEGALSTRSTQRERAGHEARRGGTGEQADRGRAGLSLVTVKVHRGQVMRKMLAKSVAELVRMADRLGVPGAA